MATAKGSAVAAGDVYRVTNTADTTDTALATYKGSAPAAGDMYRIVSLSPTVLFYLGPPVASAFDAIDAELAG